MCLLVVRLQATATQLCPTRQGVEDANRRAPRLRIRSRRSQSVTYLLTEAALMAARIWL